MDASTDFIMSYLRVHPKLAVAATAMSSAASSLVDAACDLTIERAVNEWDGVEQEFDVGTGFKAEPSSIVTAVSVATLPLAPFA